VPAKICLAINDRAGAKSVFSSDSRDKVHIERRASARLSRAGAWLQLNGEVIYGTHPWKRAVGQTSEGIQVRFTQKDSTIYATLLGQPKTATVVIKDLSPGAGAQVYLLGNPTPLAWDHQGEDIKVHLPAALPGQYAYVLRLTGPIS
jgi:alpha-L-fucosidase